MLKGPLYISPEVYRGQRQTFQSDVGIRCGIGLSKISQTARGVGARSPPQEEARASLLLSPFLPASPHGGNVVTRAFTVIKYRALCRTHSAKLPTLFPARRSSPPTAYRYAKRNVNRARSRNRTIDRREREKDAGRFPCDNLDSALENASSPREFGRLLRVAFLRSKGSKILMIL